MNQEQSPPPSRPQGMGSALRKPQPVKPRMSRLAVVAIVLAAVPCCPVVSLAGSALGITALRRIRAATGALGGLRLEQLAIAIGLMVGALSMIGLTRLGQWVDRTNHEEMTRAVETAVRGAMDGNVQEVQKVWASGPGLPADAIQSFGESALQRYGRLRWFSASFSSASGSMFQQEYEVAGVFVFDRRELTGSAAFEVRTDTGQIWPQFRLKSIEITDKENGDLRLPP